MEVSKEPVLHLVHYRYILKSRTDTDCEREVGSIETYKYRYIRRK